MTWVSLSEDGVRAEIWVERAAHRSTVGKVFRGKVVRVMPGMNAAFVELGESRAGLLQTKPDAAASIKDLVRSGETVIVQVTRDGTDEKGPRLSLSPSLPGRTVVLMPGAADRAVSQRIEDATERQRLREILVRVVPDGFGAIARTVAAGADEAAVAGEVGVMAEAWKRKVGSGSAVGEIDAGPTLAERVLQDHWIPGDAVWASGAVDATALRDALAIWTRGRDASNADSVQIVAADDGARRFKHLKKDVEAALESRVELRSGGFIVVNEIEALTAIDVNTGKFLGARSFEETALATNLEAAREMARQVRLRALAGIIVIDFIDMSDDVNREKVREAVVKEFAADRAHTRVGAFSALGLLELNRKRARPSLRQLLTVRCAACHGTGAVRDRDEERGGAE